MSNTTHKPRIFDLTKINPERVTAIRTNVNGCLTYNLNGLTADKLNNFSIGFTADALNILARRKLVIFETVRPDPNAGYRLKPLYEQFTKREAKTLANGTFNGSLMRTYAGSYVYNNNVFNYSFICLDCGARFATADDAKAHKCDAPRCCYCNRELHTNDEKSAGYCINCATARASTLYGYHDRPHRTTPFFEKPNSRNAFLHIGAEIEVDGDDGEDFDPHSGARDFSEIFNNDIYKPFAQFERDGSLSAGVEVITAPATYNGYLNRYTQFDNFYNTAKDNYGHFDRYNGLHFHLDKRYFERENDPEAVTRSAILIDYMIYKYFDFFATICHRDRDRFEYARDKARAKTLLTATMDFYNNSHANAVNHQNSNTIEVRIFGGYIDNVKAFLGALDIINALAKWAKNTTLTTAEKSTPASLVKYLHDPANVLNFVKFTPPSPYHSEAGDRLKTDFIKTLNDRINGGKK